LTDIAFHAFSLRFGTFIGNTEFEREKLELRENTCSLWNFINENRELYINPLYLEENPLTDPYLFYPETVIVHMKLWEELYMKWSIIQQT